MATNFIVILFQRQHFGNEQGTFNDIEPNVPFVGPTKDFPFNCPNVDPRETAFLMFQSRDVDHQRNVFQINGVDVFGRLPASPGRDTWNGNILLIEPRHQLRATGNVLHVESRNSSGGGGGNIDDFIIDNVVIVYRTRVDEIVDSTASPCVDLRLPPYNVIANNSTPAVAAANTVGINLAITTYSGTKACLMVPMGDVYLEQAPGSLNWSILFGTGVSDLTLAGQGMFATRLIQNGVGDLGEWDGLLVNGAQRIEVRDLAILQGTIDNPDPGQQNHLVAIYNTIAGGTTRDIYFHDVWFGNAIGDAFRVLGLSGGPEICENIRLLNFQMELNGIVNVPSGRIGARSGISIQRGYRNLEIGDGFIRGAQNSLIDMEPSGTGTMLRAYFHDLECDNSQGNTGTAVSFGGVSNGDRAAELKVRDVTVLEGRVNVISTEGAEFDRIRIKSALAFASDPNIASFVVRQINNDIQLRNLHIERIGASAAGPCMDIENSGNATTIIAPTIVQGTSQLPIRLDGCANPRIRGPQVRFDGTSPGSWDAILVAAVLANSNNPQIDDVHLISSTGKMRSAVGLYSRTPRTMDNIRVTDVNCAGCAVRAVLLSAGAGSVIDINPIVQAIDNGTDPLWRSEDQNSNEIFTIFPITQGSSARDTERCLEGNVTPNGNVVGNLGDIYRWRPTTTTAEIWFKATQTVAGVPDNTGWVRK